MKYRKLTIILFVLIPIFSFGQNTPADSTDNKSMDDGCDDRIFIKVEIPASIKKGTEALADSVSRYIANKNISFNNAAALFIFIVTANGQLVEIRNEAGYIQNENILKEALLFYSKMWTPAIQNTHIVCAYTHCEMKFEKSKLTIRVF